MVRNKGRPLLQANKMDKYAVLKPTGGTVVPEDAEGGQEKDRCPADEPSLNLKKVTEKVTNAEMDTARLQSTSKSLEDQVQFLTAEHEKIMARLEDQEGRARRNNIRVVGDLEGTKG
ncbi:hypothetical protein NDU88_012014 [Pleurodeles waltl]|uniref:Uncharacterized protein n=1 Tax=Pleurodeles waltl TaxID=8319 RepID=A0AAV7R517_PLEWA|nr:hypothetical protein NDU88_012014 [Pleurodeles waltl]